MAYYTPGTPPTPRPTPDWTCNSLYISRTTGLRTLQSNGKNTFSLALSTTSCQPLPHPTTRTPDTSPTWLSWDSTSACVPAITPSALSIAVPSSSVPSSNLCPPSATPSYPLTPRSISFNMSLRSSSPWTTRRTPSEMRPSLTLYRIPHQLAQLNRSSTYSSACENTDATLPPQSTTNLPIKVSAWSESQTSSQSSGWSASEWERLESDSPQKTSEHTLSALEDPWPRTLQGSYTGPSWPPRGEAR